MICCGIMGYQDFKTRAVYWFLFPILAICLGTLHYFDTEKEVFLLNIGFGLTIITAIVIILYLYTQYISKKKFLNYSIGLGDLLLFYVFAIAFPPYTFIVLFSSSIIFSFLSFLFFKNKVFKETIPLAGLMSIFLGLVIGYSLLYNNPSLYLV